MTQHDSQFDTSWPQQEILLLEHVEEDLRRGMKLHRWWREELDAQDAYPHRFELCRDDDRDFGFYGELPQDGASADLPVMGCVQTSRAVIAPPDGDLRRFVLRDFLSSGDIFKYRRFYSKCAETGRIERFAQEDREKIDLRELDSKYEWLVVHVQISNFKIPFGRFGLPMNAENWIVLSRDLLIEDDGRYGLGYAFLRETSPGFLTYGPGRFETAFQTFDFAQTREGSLEIRMGFASNRPKQWIRPKVPRPFLRWAARLTGETRESVERRMLNLHATCHGRMLAGVGSYV